MKKLAKTAAQLAIALTIASPLTGQTKSGYGPTAGLETGDSVTEDIRQDDLDAGAAFRFPDQPLKPWFDAKRRWNDNFGLKLNFSYQALYQSSDNTTGYDEAAAGRGEINGSWTLLGRGTPNSGRLTFRFENRRKWGTPVVPQKLGNQFGSGTFVGTGFSDFGYNISEVAWRQAVAGGRVKFVFGKISAAGWYGGHALSSPKRAFQNSAFLSSNSRAIPGRGFGAGMGFQFSPHVVAVAGIHDANAKTAGDPFDTIQEGEFHYNAEVRWLPNGMERARWDQARLHVWYQDPRKEAGTSESYGADFVLSYLFNDRVMPFLLGGISAGDAAIFKADLAGGVGIGFDVTNASKARDVMGIALAWGDPTNSALQEQTTGELYYRFQLLDNFALTPSIQFIKNPIANASETTITVLGLRARVTF